MTRGQGLVVGFGALSVDEIVHVDAPLRAGKGRVISRTHAFGGNVATALVAVARLGGNASYIGWLSDEPNDPATQDLLKNCVRTDQAARSSESRPIRSLISVGSDGERFIAFDDDVQLGTSLDTLDTTLAEASTLLIDGYAIHALDAVERARNLAIPIVADIEWAVGEATEQLIAMSDHLVVPLAFGRSYTGRSAPEDVLDALWSPDRSAVVLTDGERGVHFRDGAAGPVWYLPAHDVRAEDTTGAGDCFHGAYAWALTLGTSTGDRVKFASAAAALSVMGRGGREALPDCHQVADLLARKGAPELTENA